MKVFLSNFRQPMYRTARPDFTTLQHLMSGIHNTLLFVITFTNEFQICFIMLRSFFIRSRQCIYTQRHSGVRQIISKQVSLTKLNASFMSYVPCSNIIYVIFEYQYPLFFGVCNENISQLLCFQSLTEWSMLVILNE